MKKRKSRILLVEDEQDVQDAYRVALERAGFDVAAVGTVAAARERVLEYRPELAVIDGELPDGNGLTLAHDFKRDPELEGLFILCVSGRHVKAEDMARTLEAGADGFLVKPVEELALVAHARAMMRIQETERQLREANRRLLEFNRLKAEFVANMSHELRTPLTAIIGFAQLILKRSGKDPLSPAHQSNVERILRNGRQLLALVDDVLDISKIEAGRMIVHPEAFDLAELIQMSFAELRSLVEESDVEYRLVIKDEFPLAYTDPLRVRQVFVNLLSNAIKFTERGYIQAELSKGPDSTFRLTVRDTGIGIAPADLKSIFDRFRQVDGTSTRSQGGSGLGLTIVEQVTELLGGSLDVQSQPGEGSVFTATLPLVIPHAEALQPFRPGMEAGAPPPVSGDNRPLVLVIEDDEDAATLLMATLQRAGYRVEVAARGITGIQLARELQPSVITLDIMMPSIDGFRVLQALRSDPRTAAIPIVICSIIDNRPLGYRLGASDYLIKPVEPQLLLDSLRRVGATLERGTSYLLVVDDEHGVRDLLVSALRHAGYEARSAASGEVAYAMATERPPAAILCDLLMPGGMSGFELVARLRSQPQTDSIPIIVVTGKDLSSDDQRLLRGQIADVIRKGDLMMPHLEERLREVLEEVGIKP